MSKTIQASSKQRDGKADSSQSVGSAVFASTNLMAITGPCGHSVPIEDAMEGPDRYSCPTCGIRYHIHQEPPTVYPSGFIMPGDRTIVIDPHGNLPNEKRTDWLAAETPCDKSYQIDP